MIADLGCGEGKLELSLKKVHPDIKIYSFDIGKLNPHVRQADIACLPLESDSVDICVFSLSLMSTNYVEHLIEAVRVLKTNGLLLIAEVSSRFQVGFNNPYTFSRPEHNKKSGKPLPPPTNTKILNKFVGLINMLG